MSITAARFFKDTVDRLTPSLGKGEAEAAARIIFEDVAGYDRKYIFVNGDRKVLDFVQSRINAAVDKVLAGEPVQYAVGRAQFMGNTFAVSPAVLIPRPETAGLVDIIISDYNGRSDLRVLDIGTGSGCIAISLARALPFADVRGIDVSTDALKVAENNAKALSVNVRFIQADIIKTPPPSSAEYDIIVSNPPYVCVSEAKDIEPRVLDYEPHTALFVPDDNPLLFIKPLRPMPGRHLFQADGFTLKSTRVSPKKCAPCFKATDLKTSTYAATISALTATPQQSCPTISKNATKLFHS